ncbi:MAG: hypothetical protein ACRCYY_20255 [Trueperaceae bacterium]
MYHNHYVIYQFARAKNAEMLEAATTSQLLQTAKLDTWSRLIHRFQGRSAINIVTEQEPSLR